VKVETQFFKYQTQVVSIDETVHERHDTPFLLAIDLVQPFQTLDLVFPLASRILCVFHDF
jgi:hypothetical protein